MIHHKFYLASRFGRREELRIYARQLEERGYEVTSRWIKPNHESTGHDDADNAKFAQEDVEDILRADTFVHFTESPLYFEVKGWKPLPASTGGCSIWTASTAGRHREAGIVLGAWYCGSPRHYLIVGPQENVFDALPAVEARFDTWEGLLLYLVEQDLKPLERKAS